MIKGVMTHLSEIIDWIDGRGYDNLGFILFGLISKRYSADGGIRDVEELKGLCLERIVLNDDWWQNGISCIDIVEAEPSDFSYAYFPPEYLDRGEWDESSSVFALCTIIYRMWTCMLPYIDHPDDDVDENNIDDVRARNLAQGRRFPLFLDYIPEPLHPFFQKALALKKKDRYHSLKAAADDFFHLPFAGTLYIKSDGTPISKLELIQQEYLNRKNKTTL